MNILRCILPIPLKYRLVISDTREVEAGESKIKACLGYRMCSVLI